MKPYLQYNASKNRSKAADRKIVIMSACTDDWGGSEELWAGSIPFLHAENFTVTVVKEKINRQHSKFIELKKSGVLLKELRSSKNLAGRIARKIWRKLMNKNENPSIDRFNHFLRKSRPDLVVISQGINFDGLVFAHVSLVRKIPYVIICQKAVEFYWPSGGDRAYMIKTFQQAAICFFVSKQNLQLTQEQFGILFSNARLIGNPVKIPLEPVPYPSDDKGFKLACVGRLFIIDKGQDILLRIMSKPKWKARPLHISFIGNGVDASALQSMADLMQADNVSFDGFTNDVKNIWLDHHALILPSRSEGLPLVVLEAMASARTAIVTFAGGSSEIIEDGNTGFIGDATTASFEDALERAWNKREEWKSMGQKAFEHLKNHLSLTPETDFAKALTKLIYEP